MEPLWWEAYDLGRGWSATIRESFARQLLHPKRGCGLRNSVIDRLARELPILGYISFAQWHTRCAPFNRRDVGAPHHRPANVCNGGDLIHRFLDSTLDADSPVSIAAALVLLLALGSGCSDANETYSLPNDRVWESLHFRYQTRSTDGASCEAVLIQLEQHFQLLQTYLGFEWPISRKVDYYKFVDRDDYLSSGKCPSDAEGCTSDSSIESRAGTRLSSANGRSAGLLHRRCGEPFFVRDPCDYSKSEIVDGSRHASV